MEKQNLVTQNVQAGEYEAYLAYPAEGKNLPGVIIIHEIFGLNDNIRSIARRFAENGYVGLAVDLFSKDSSRRLCIVKTVTGMMLNVRKTSHMGALDGAVNFLQAQPSVEASRIGIIGFCMGGGYALAFATHNHELKAASIFYGTNPKPLNSVAEACPIVGSYPEKDFTTGAAKKLEQELTTFQRSHDIKIYPGAKHSFFNDTSKAYNQEAAEDAWQRTMSFFKEHVLG